jgi:ABC-2 type transport system permease protein
MSSPANAKAPIRPFTWSVRRELWESRSISIGPLAGAGLVLFGYLITTFRLPHAVQAALSLPLEKQAAVLNRPLHISAAAIMFVALIVGVFYCLGALNNERRDRRILFWKSLPVSDLTAVLAKAAIPLLVLPLIVIAMTLATQLIMLIVGSAILLANGMGAATLWANFPLPRTTLGLIYIVFGTALWYAPIYAWLLMVSSWARRVPILWAVLPVLGLGIVERIAFDTMYIASLVAYRFTGFITQGFPAPSHGKAPQVDQLSAMAPEQLLSSPGLWLGLVVAAAFLAAAVWLRRWREPG